MKYSLIIDTGTSSMRGILFGEEHSILYVSRQKYFMALTEGGAAEQEASVYKACLENILKDCADYAVHHQSEIDRIALTSQRSSVLAVDREGHALAPVMMWYDKRPQYICDQLNEAFGSEIYEVTGMYARPMFSAPKMRWLKENAGEIYENAFKLAGIQDYLIYLLTGEWVTDRTFGSRTNLMDLAKGQWSDRMLAVFGIDRDKLCRLISPGDEAGKLAAHYWMDGIAKEAGVFSAGGDQQCSAIGQGLYGRRMIGVTNGTASYVAVCRKEWLWDAEHAIHINRGAVCGSWLMEASNMGTGSVYDWVRHLLYEDADSENSIAMMNTALEQTDIGAGGIIAFPYLAGKGMPDWDTNQWGCLLNLGLASSRADIARAFLEGLAFEISECYERMEAAAGVPEMIQVSGGLSGLPMFNQMLADILNRTVTTVSCRETTGVGAYIVLLLACGDIEEKDIDGLVLRENPKDYEPEAGHVQQYAALRKKRRRIEAGMPFGDIHTKL